MNKTVIMEQEDIIRMKDCEIRALQEELDRERSRREAAQDEADLSFQQLASLSSQNKQLRSQIESWTKEVDAKAALEQQLQRQGFEL